MKNQPELKVRLYNLLWPKSRKRSPGLFLGDEDPEAGRRWYQKPRSRDGDLWVDANNICWTRKDGQWVWTGKQPLI